MYPNNERPSSKSIDIKYIHKLSCTVYTLEYMYTYTCDLYKITTQINSKIFSIEFISLFVIFNSNRFIVNRSHLNVLLSLLLLSKYRVNIVELSKVSIEPNPIKSRNREVEKM